MRGLTPEEYACLVEAAEYCGCTPSMCGDAPISTEDDCAVMDRLIERGLVDEIECSIDEGWYHDFITTYGREALRMYQALRTMQVSL